MRGRHTGPCQQVPIRDPGAITGRYAPPMKESTMPIPRYIMIVDDNPANLKLLEDMLLQQGYEARSFLLGSMAMAAAVKHPPCLFLLDINMPEMNGYDLCERIKSIHQLSE